MSYNREEFDAALLEAHRASKLSLLIAEMVADGEAPAQRGVKVAEQARNALKRLTTIVHGEAAARMVTIVFEEPVSA